MDSLLRQINRPKAPDEGLGWLLEYVCRLLKTYPSFNREFVWDELPMIEGWAYFSWAYENDAMNQLGGVSRTSPSYIKQESEKLISQALAAWAKEK